MVQQRPKVLKTTHGLALDIDETLSWTVGYWAERLMIKFGNPEQLTVEQFVATYRYAEKAPYWQTPEAHALMLKWCNSNEVQKELRLIEGADMWVKKIHKIIPIVAYATLRPECVRSGTIEWLKRHKLPNAPMIMRPEGLSWDEGNKWKAAVLQEAYPHIQGIIDDRVGIVEELAADYTGTVFLYTHDEVPRTDIRAIACPTWKAVYEAVKKIYD